MKLDTKNQVRNDKAIENLGPQGMKLIISEENL